MLIICTSLYLRVYIYIEYARYKRYLYGRFHATRIRESIVIAHPMQCAVILNLNYGKHMEGNTRRDSNISIYSYINIYIHVSYELRTVCMRAFMLDESFINTKGSRSVALHICGVSKCGRIRTAVRTIAWVDRSIAAVLRRTAEFLLPYEKNRRDCSYRFPNIIFMASTSSTLTSLKSSVPLLN